MRPLGRPVSVRHRRTRSTHATHACRRIGAIGGRRNGHAAASSRRYAVCRGARQSPLSRRQWPLGEAYDCDRGANGSGSAMYETGVEAGPPQRGACESNLGFRKA